MRVEFLGEDGRVVCVEPFAGMRAEGMRRVTDSRVEWSAILPCARESFERILCGAAIWQLDPLPERSRVAAPIVVVPRAADAGCVCGLAEDSGLDGSGAWWTIPEGQDAAYRCSLGIAGSFVMEVGALAWVDGMEGLVL